jgi:hypothetical protein
LNAFENRAQSFSQHSGDRQKKVQSRRTHHGACHQTTYTNGKPGKAALLDYRKGLKTGLLRLMGRSGAGDRGSGYSGSNRSARSRSARSRLNTTMLIKSGAFADRRSLRNPRRFSPLKSNEHIIRRSPNAAGRSLSRKKGKLSQLNVTMLIKSGAMARPNTIQVNKPRISVGIRRRQRTGIRARIIRARKQGRTPLLRIRRNSWVGGRCVGRNCR